MAEIKITSSNFESEVLDANIPVIVDFWAPWCGPCRMLAPVLAEIAEENEGAVVVGKINVDEEPQLAAQFGIASIPTLIVFKSGEISAKSVGVKPKAQILDMIK
ncbi:MAG: thioredoxin [Ruminococcaceae bacterium]|nr:thioredoxin [Oscillospiraceae bacterium]